MGTNFEYVNCPVCGFDQHSKLYSITYFNDDILPKIGIKEIPERTFMCLCLRCKHRYANPQLSDEALDLYYTKINSEYYQEGIEPANKLLFQHRKVVQEIESQKSNGSILEIGCGNGFLLSMFSKENWRTVGVEPYGPAAAFAKENLGLNIVNGYLDTNTFSDLEKFDIILLFDVMEHLKDPNSMLNLINYYLKPGGLLVMGTGDAGSLNALLSGSQWTYTTLREHISFFSKESMLYLLKDFEDIKINSVSYMGSPFANGLNFFKNLFFRHLYNAFQSAHYKFTNFKVTRYKYVRYLLAFDHVLVIAHKPLNKN